MILPRISQRVGVLICVTILSACFLPSCAKEHPLLITGNLGDFLRQEMLKYGATTNARRFPAGVKLAGKWFVLYGDWGTTVVVNDIGVRQINEAFTNTFGTAEVMSQYPNGKKQYGIPATRAGVGIIYEGGSTTSLVSLLTWKSKPEHRYKTSSRDYHY